MQHAKEQLAGVVRYWDSVADRYLELFRHEFQGKPYDRQVITSFAESLSRGARVCDAGCGPCGHVTRLLADSGLNVVGVDISPRCIWLARREQPLLQFKLMDFGSLQFGDGELQGVVAYYALHYQPKSSLAEVLKEFARVLRIGGRLLLVAKEGHGEGFVDDPLGSSQQVFWSALTAQDLQELVSNNGFAVLSCDVREPLSDEIAARRIYLTAKRLDEPL